MERSLLYRGLMIAAIVLIAAWAAFPPGEKINLGLDLQGGMHLVLQVETDDALEAEADNAVYEIERELEDLGMAATVERTGDTGIQVIGLADDRVSEFEDEVLDRFLPGWNVERSDGRLALSLSSEQLSSVRQLAVDQAQETLRNRVDAFGVAEPIVHDEGLGSERIVVQLPGVDDPERIKELLQSTAFLELRLASPNAQPFDSRQEAINSVPGGLDSGVYEVYPETVRDDQRNAIGERWWVIETKRVITGRDLRDARPSTGQFGEPSVAFMLNREGGRKFGEITGANIGRGLVILLDGRIQSVATIQDRITDQGTIHGTFTQQEVQDLVTVLRSGALPAGLTILEERTVGPTLGRDSIIQGRNAGMVGGLLVILAMLIVYKFTGLNAITALALNVILVFGALSLLGATLTLPGIAGIVLTIGMAVDANVLVFERIREELRAGKTVKMAIDNGFDKALSSILDANVTTLIAAIFLFMFGTGPIRGFAVTLSIGIFASVFTAVIVSRWLFDLIYSRRTGRVEKLSI